MSHPVNPDMEDFSELFRRLARQMKPIDPMDYGPAVELPEGETPWYKVSQAGIEATRKWMKEKDNG